MDTIIAISTSPVTVGAVGIIRLSGENALQFARQIFHSKELIEPIIPRYMYLGIVSTEFFKDKGFLVYYKSPKSYTGEDVVEFQLHGGISIMQGVLKTLISLGARPAKNGEFTKRAFLNNKMSLADCEGVIEMINATSEAELNQAYKLQNGELTKSIQTEIDRILLAITYLEAVLDYPEELEDDTREPSKLLLKESLAELKSIYKTSQYSRIISDGITVAIIGLPNSGKSSLLNALLSEDKAIVTEIAGTTRDVLKETVSVKGIKLSFLDTAGIRHSEDIIETLGIERSKNSIKQADFVLNIIDLATPHSSEEDEILKLLGDKKFITVGNKSDKDLYNKQVDIKCQAKYRKNIEAIYQEILKQTNAESIYQATILMQERHIYAVQKCIADLESAIENFDFTPIDCTLIDIRNAYLALAEITGANISDEVTDSIFRTFCVGK